MAILGCEYAYVSTNTDLVAVFRNCVGQYAKNSTIFYQEKVSWADAQRKLLVHAYCWLLYHFDQAEAHAIHRNLIVHSLFWLAFAKSFDDRNRPGRIPFNPKYWKENMRKGRTAMNAIGDPMSKADKLFSTLALLFDDVRLQRRAVGAPCRENYKQQEDEIITHLGKLASDKQHDAYPLPASVPKAILVLRPDHRWWEQMPNAPRGVAAQRLAQAPLLASELELEEEETDMDTSAPESTDTEMFAATERALFITHDYQAEKIKNVVRIQEEAAAVARSDVQSQFYETVGSDTRVVRLKRENEGQYVEPKRRASPEQGPRHEERGRSILKKKTANTGQDAKASRSTRSDPDVPRGVGSPLSRLPGNRTPMGTGSSQASQQTAFQDALKKCYEDSVASRSRSRKREHSQALKATAPTPTQSPAQKNFKLKSTVTVVSNAARSGNQSQRREPTPAWRPTDRAPYHLINVPSVASKPKQESEVDLVKYMMNRFTRDYYAAELNDVRHGLWDPDDLHS